MIRIIKYKVKTCFYAVLIKFTRQDEIINDLVREKVICQFEQGTYTNSAGAYRSLEQREFTTELQREAILHREALFQHDNFS